MWIKCSEAGSSFLENNKGNAAAVCCSAGSNQDQKNKKTKKKPAGDFCHFLRASSLFLRATVFFFFAKSFYLRNFVSTIGFFNIKHSCRLATSRPLILFVIRSPSCCHKFSHTCQLSWIDYYTNLQVSRTGHHISRINSSFELFCALVWDVTHFQLKAWMFGIRSTVSGAFFTYLVIDKDYFLKTMIANSGTKFSSPQLCEPFNQAVNRPVCPCK